MQGALLIFREPLRDLKTSLQRVRNLIDDIIENTPQALGDSKIRQRHETTLGSVVVVLSGFFESFLRDVAEAYADDIGRRVRPFADLPERIRQTHFSGGGAVLSNIGRRTVPAPYRWVHANASDVARRLSSVVGPPPYELLWEAFAETKGNPGPEVLKEFLRRFGVEKPMETLAKHVGKTHNTIRMQLDSFLAIRNECAHSGMPKMIPTASEVHDYCTLLEELGDGIVSALTAQDI